MTKKLLILNSLYMLFIFETQAVIRYVAPTSTGNGTSWTNASNDLQLMINNSAAGDTIWVAAGTYLPIRPADNLGTISYNNRDNAFVLKKDVSIFGGFSGNETHLSQRNWNTNPTILSGDIGVPNDISDNCYHVVISSGDVGTARLDGFTITKGNANKSGDYIIVNGLSLIGFNGGGMYNISSSPIVTNITIIENNANSAGGGIYNIQSSPTLTNITISRNKANRGGGIHIEYGSPTLTHVIISKNHANDEGGVVYNEGRTSPIFINVIISGNSAGSFGGGIFNNNSSPMFTNVVISGNSADKGGGICTRTYDSPILTNVTICGNRANENGGGICNSGSLAIRNSIVFGNMANNGNNVDHNAWTLTFSYSLIEGSGGSSSWVSSFGTDGGNNIDNNPLFISPIPSSLAPTITGNYRLQHNSPAIDVGNNTFLNGITTDLDGSPRIYNGTVDLGAYEWHRLDTTNYSATICQGEHYTDNNFTNLTIAGRYYKDNGYDSVIELILTVNPVYFTQIEDTICNGDSYNFFGKNLTINGVYLDTLPTTNGCDSVFELNLTVNPTTEIHSLKPNSYYLCEGENLKVEATISGENLVYQWYHNDTLLLGEQNRKYIVYSADKMDAGRYYVEAFGACGNAKSHTITIDVGSTNIFVEKWHDVILVDNSSWQYFDYQWYKDGKIINGATEQFYQEIGGLKGCYSVELTQEGGGKIRTCERCFDKTEKNNIQIYPNPTSGKIVVESEKSKVESIDIFDIVGKKHDSHFTFHNSHIEIDISHLSAGIYFLKVDGQVFKIIKQ